MCIIISARFSALSHGGKNNKNQPEQVEIYLNQAMRYTNNDKNRKSLMAMINDPSELD